MVAFSTIQSVAKPKDRSAYHKITYGPSCPRVTGLHLIGVSLGRAGDRLCVASSFYRNAIYQSVPFGQWKNRQFKVNKREARHHEHA